MAVNLVDAEAFGNPRVWVAEVAERTGCGADRRRRYDEQSVQRIELLVRLRATGMPTVQMREFAELLSGGIETHKRRLEILVAHRQRILAGQQRLAECLDAVDTKTTHYRRLEGE